MFVRISNCRVMFVRISNSRVMFVRISNSRALRMPVSNLVASLSSEYNKVHIQLSVRHKVAQMMTALLNALP